MKFLSILCACLVSSVAFAEELRCEPRLSPEAESFAARAANQPLVFMYRNGDLHKFTISESQRGEFAVKYSDMMTGRSYYENMALYFCQTDETEQKFVMAYKGGQRFDAKILLPMDDSVLGSSVLQSYADLRWGRWAPARVFLQN